MRLIFACLVMLVGSSITAQPPKNNWNVPMHPGETWNDTNGKPINAHGQVYWNIMAFIICLVKLKQV
jgi:hypothetical protein